MNPSSAWEDIGPFRALVDPGQRSPELVIALADLSSRLNQGLVEVLREEPCRTIRLHLMEGRSERDMVIQVFAETRKGAIPESRGAHSYRVAQSLAGLGIDVPPPLACLERRAGPRVLESYFLGEYLAGASSFDRELGRLFTEAPDFKVMADLVAQVAQALRNMHGLGVYHRALNNRCVIVTPSAANRPRRVLFVDLFRARLGRAPTMGERADDAAGLCLPPQLRRVFWEAYWAGPAPRAFEHWECGHRQARRWIRRTPVPALLDHPAVPPSRLPAEREQWLWDHTAQAAVNLTHDPVRPLKHPSSRPSFVAQILAQQIVANLFSESMPMDHFLAAGICAQPETLASEVALLGKLGLRDVMARLCCHDPPECRRFALAAVQQMAQSGFRVSGAFVQDRRAVRDPKIWTHFVNQVLGCVGWQLQRIEFGHAVNLPAWGIRSRDEYRGFLATLPELQNAYPGVAFAGPGLDGFDYRFARQALKALPAGCRWDAFAMRVDACPAWHGLSDDALLRRCAGLVAEIRHQGNCAPRLILSEMSHTGRIAAGEDRGTVAERLIRRILALTCAGLVEQTVLWWFSNLSSQAEDPVVQALVRLRALLAGGRYVKRLHAGDSRRVFLLHCETALAQPVLVGWVDGPPLQVEVPFRAASAMDIHGRTAPLLPHPRLRLTSTPVYFQGS